MNLFTVWTPQQIVAADRRMLNCIGAKQPEKDCFREMGARLTLHKNVFAVNWQPKQNLL